MANKQAGEITLSAGDTQLKLKLTLGALAEIEDAFGISSLDELGAKLSKPGTKDLLLLLSACCGGGGNPKTPDELKGMSISVSDAMEAMTKVINLGDINPPKAPTATEPKPDPE